MNLSLNSNASALGAKLHLGRNTMNLQKSIARLSSGQRIEKPSDDAGGMAVATRSLKARFFAQVQRCKIF